MIEPFAELLMHFGSGRRAIELSTALLDLWKAGPRPPMLVFGRSGPGVEATHDTLRARLVFDRDRQDVAITLRTRRSPRDADRLEVFFTNPGHQWERPVNFTALSMFHDGLATGHPGYSLRDLQSLIYGLALVEQPTSVSLERYEVLHHPEVYRACCELAKAHNARLMPYWISALPRWAFGAVRESGRVQSAEVICELGESLVLVQIGRWPFSSVEEQAATILKAVESIKKRIGA